jgi:soluble lytic murein transglycosylase-like protein
VTVAANGTTMSDAGGQYGDVNFGAPLAPTPQGEAMARFMAGEMQNGPRSGGAPIVLDDFGNVVGGGSAYKVLADQQAEINKAIQWANDNLTGQERNQYIGAVLNNYSAGISSLTQGQSADYQEYARALLMGTAQTAKAAGYDPMQFQNPIPEGGRALTDTEFRNLQDIYHQAAGWQGVAPASNSQLAQAQNLLAAAGVIDPSAQLSQSQLRDTMRDFIGDRYNSLYVYAGALNQVPPELLKAQDRQESKFDYRAQSSSGAVGISQFLAGTGRDYGLTVNSTVDDRLDPAKSIMAQAQYMRSLYTHMTEGSTVEDQWRLALASYNAGRGTINRAMEVYGNDLGLPTSASRVGMVDADVLINSYLPAPGQSAANGAQTQEYVRRIYGFGPTPGGYTRYYQQRF